MENLLFGGKVDGFSHLEIIQEVMHGVIQESRIKNLFEWNYREYLTEDFIGIFDFWYKHGHLGQLQGPGDDIDQFLDIGDYHLFNILACGGDQAGYDCP